MHSVTKGLTAAAMAAGLMFAITACNEDTSSQAKESKSRQDTYDRLVANEPAKSMAVSPTRKTINAWIEKWGKNPNKLSYVYLQNGNGDYSYFVLKGLPVSMCAMLTPNYEIKDRGTDSSDLVVPAPGMDGAYYSGSQCNSYYGIDGTTGTYVEFSVGQNQSYFLYDQPQSLPQFKDAKPLGPTSLKDAAK